MKNGCCRDCMKAFSKSNKVIIFTKTMYRVVYVKFLDCREEQRFQQMDANIVVVRVVTLLISEKTKDKKS
jgi:hypothetical protein